MKKNKEMESAENLETSENLQSDLKGEISLVKLQEQVEKLTAEIQEKDKDIERCEKLIDDYKSKANSYLNTASYYKEQAETNKKDFDRYKERNKNIESDAIKKANESVAKQLLPVMDNFDHAMMAVSPEVMKGFVMIYSSIQNILKDLGVAEISCKNEKLNPEKHNCIETTKTDNKELDDVISRVYQKGYMFAESGEVIREATVAVYKFD